MPDRGGWRVNRSRPGPDGPGSLTPVCLRLPDSVAGISRSSGGGIADEQPRRPSDADVDRGAAHRPLRRPSCVRRSRSRTWKLARWNANSADGLLVESVPLAAQGRERPSHGRRLSDATRRTVRLRRSHRKSAPPHADPAGAGRTRKSGRRLQSGDRNGRSAPAGPERRITTQDVQHPLPRQFVLPGDGPHRLPGQDRLNNGRVARARFSCASRVRSPAPPSGIGNLFACPPPVPDVPRKEFVHLPPPMSLLSEARFCSPTRPSKIIP